jgi:LysM repeat protein
MRGVGVVLWALAVVTAACGPAATGTPRPSATAPLLPLMSATAAVAPRGTAGPPPTPVIIASPTATATPVTHVVAEGETLLGIAIQYGVSVEALQAANPNVQARFLSIGTVLVIPPPEGGFAVAATNLAPPPPAPVALGEPACYPLAAAGVYCLVAARNPGIVALENVSARVTLAGADGLPLTSAVAYAALDLIPPGEAAPLAVLFQPGPVVPVAATGVEVLTGNLAGEPAPPGRAVPLRVSNARGEMIDGRWMATGQVQNGNGPVVTTVWVILTVYDAEGRPVGYRKQPLAGGLAPGETREFSVAADVLAGPVARHELLAEGRP